MNSSAVRAPGTSRTSGLAQALHRLRNRVDRFLERHFPERLYARSLIIVVTPVVVLQLIMTYIFMERHYETVTRSLAESYISEVVLLISLYNRSDQGPDTGDRILDLANKDLKLATLSAKGRLAFEMTIERGRGYLSGDRQNPTATIGIIPVEELGGPGGEGDGELVAGAAQPGDHLPARADPADSPAGGGGASLRHGAGCCQFQAFRGARDPGSLECLHHDEGADRAQCRAAHRHAGGRFA